MPTQPTHTQHEYTNDTQMTPKYNKALNISICLFLDSKSQLQKPQGLI